MQPHSSDNTTHEGVGGQVGRYSSLDFYARQVVEGYITGRHRSPFHGFSVEFADYRQYNTGESTRHIDWRLYGRTDRLYVKNYEEETNLRCYVLIDSSRSMWFPVDQMANFTRPNKLTFAACSAAVLVEMLYRQRDAFALTLFDQETILQTECRSNALHRKYIMEQLDELLIQKSVKQQAQQETNVAQTLHSMAEKMHRRSLVVLFTDALTDATRFDDILEALRHVRHNRHEVILFHTLDNRHETELQYGARPHRFIDLESGKTINLNPVNVAKSYTTAMNECRQRLIEQAMQYHIEYVGVDIEKGIHPVLLPFLLYRNKIR
ncbi:MAG: DUF58 domain-containing protein [Bacteroidales bacterium]|nr:DUF58 domain-containing protein [Bacteroidales bacterium]